MKPRERVTVGAFTIEFLRVTHSMPDCVALAIETPHGVVIHTGDFKIDQTPLDGDPMDVPRLAELGSAGVLALLADSTNIDRKGVSGSELDVTDAFEEIFTGADGKIVVAMFASSIFRMQIVVDLAAQFDRRVAFVGRGVIENSEIAQRLGYLRIPAGVQMRDSEVRNTSVAGCGLHLHGVAGRAAGRAAADRDQRSPARAARAGRRRRVLGPGDSRQRESHRARDEPYRPPARRGRLRGDQARARVGARQRGRAQAHAVARKAAATSCRYTGSTGSSPCMPGSRPAFHGTRKSCWRRTATSSASTTTGGGLRTRCRPAGC